MIDMSTELHWKNWMDECDRYVRSLAGHSESMHSVTPRTRPTSLKYRYAAHKSLGSKLRSRWGLWQVVCPWETTQLQLNLLSTSCSPVRILRDAQSEDLGRWQEVMHMP